jgi:diguanylate cyclase
MKYVQDRNASVETLRTIIKMMAAHPAAFTPLNYAVWYEHLVGTNAKLSSELSKLLEGGAQLDDEILDNLYEVYITPDCQQDHLKRLIDKITGFTKETDKQANIFGNSLQSYGNSLKQELGPEELESLISTMAADTNKMQGSISTLQAELAASHQQIEKLNQELNSARGEAMIDPLTGVLNRRGFDIAAKKMCSAGRQVGTCLLMIDIDHFKKVNDTYGHLFGDKVIQALAETLKLKTSAKDIVSRFGGEEFAVLLPGIGSINAVKVAERLRQTIEAGKIRQANSQDYIDGITISIGISTYHDDMTIVELLDQADKALYISKEQGRNRATFFEPTILSHHEVFFK